MTTVAGNDEFQSGQIETAFGKTRAAAAAKGITFLEREEVIVGGMRFLGCTLRSDFCLLADDHLLRMKSEESLCTDHYGGSH